MSKREHDGDDAVGHRDQVDVGADRTLDLLDPQLFGARLTQFGQGGHLEHPTGHVGLETGEEPTGQRVTLEGVHQGHDERLPPVGDVGLDEGDGQRLVDDAGGVLVHGGEEQGLFAREVGVGHGATDRRVTGDVGHRRGSVALPAEAGDGGVEDGPARLGALGRRRRRSRAHGLHSTNVTV